jgi:hypothetical protein
MAILMARRPDGPAVAAGALGEVHMDMILMVPVGAGAEHGGEPGASVLAQAFAKVLGDVGIGQLHHRAVCELERADIDGVGLAMLGKFRADDAIAAAALIRVEVIDALECASEGAHGGRQVLAHPLHDHLGKRAANDRRRRHPHARLVGEPHRLEPHRILHAALAGPGQRRQRGRNGQFGREP